MKLETLKSRLFFTARDVARAAGITLPSAHVLCSRYTRAGIFLRLKKNVYVIRDAWDRFDLVDVLKIANYLQVPSYVSFTTALSFYGITTQVQRNWIECAAAKRSTTIQAGGVTFRYHKLQETLFFGFSRENGLFIAAPEKALLDAAYLEVLGSSAVDRNAVDPEKLDQARLRDLLKAYPNKFIRKMAEICGI
jgi:predicted transcriptional regulator of viral defense system